jgi:putative ABC transport system ATP-binding protein
MDPIISVRDVVKHYDDGRIHALDGVTLDVAQGEFVAIIGPSGSGKSTLLHILGALDVADEGAIVVDGRDLSAVHDLASFRRVTVGFVFQLHNLIPTLTAWENVQVPLMECRMSPVERKQRALELLAELDLTDRAENLPAELSGGERQRVAIARALANEPRILIADEPTGAVDSANSARILELLKRLARERGMTLIVVTHDPTVAAAADRIITILDGTVKGAA